MTETKTIWLDETDLKRILAEKFKTNAERRILQGG